MGKEVEKLLNKFKQFWLVIRAVSIVVTILVSSVFFLAGLNQQIQSSSVQINENKHKINKLDEEVEDIKIRLPYVGKR